MGAAFTYRQKMDISYCGDKTGFPRPGHIYKKYCTVWVVIFEGLKFRVISKRL